jgi:flagellar hook-length control protein FliK
MTIELAPPAANPSRPATASASTEGKPKTSGGRSGNGAPGGFMAVLAAAENTALQDVTDKGDSTSVDVNVAANNLLAADGLAPPQAGDKVDDALTLAQMAVSMMGKTPDQAAAGNAAHAAPGVRPGGNSAVLAGVSGADSGHQVLGALESATAQSSKKLTKALGESTSNNAAADTTGAGLSTQTAAAAEKDAQWMPALDSAKAMAQMIEVNTPVMASLVGQERPTDDKVKSRAAERDGPATAPATAPTPNAIESSKSADGAQALDSYVAEQVSYWIANDVQKAEMKLDGLGKDPVEVSIRMHGNEAHVTFRSDELQTRDALAGAGAHLKDLLAQQGLSLTGVSVGTSNQGEQGRKDKGAARDGRQVGVVTVPVNAAGSAAGSRLGVGRALDLFV